MKMKLLERCVLTFESQIKKCLPVKKHLFEIELLLVQDKLGLLAHTSNLERNRLGILFHTADKRVQVLLDLFGNRVYFDLLWMKTIK